MSKTVLTLDHVVFRMQVFIVLILVAHPMAKAETAALDLNLVPAVSPGVRLSVVSVHSEACIDEEQVACDHVRSG